MLKSRLQMSFQSSGHTTSALRALSYGSPLSKFKDDTDGIGFYEVVRDIEEHFEEKKAELIQKLKTALPPDFPCGQCDDQLYLFRGWELLLWKQLSWIQWYTVSGTGRGEKIPCDITPEKTQRKL